MPFKLDVRVVARLCALSLTLSGSGCREDLDESCLMPTGHYLVSTEEYELCGTVIPAKTVNWLSDGDGCTAEEFGRETVEDDCLSWEVLDVSASANEVGAYIVDVVLADRCLGCETTVLTKLVNFAVEPGCEEVPEPCANEGARRCNEVRDGIESCRHVDGCLTWSAYSECDSGQVCVEGAGPVACDDPPTCHDQCARVGDLQCEANSVASCSVGPGGCLEWSVTIDCSAQGQYCSHGVCQLEPCVDGCLPGETRCDGFLVWACSSEDYSCREWTLVDDCSDNNPLQTCNASSGTARCVDI